MCPRGAPSRPCVHVAQTTLQGLAQQEALSRRLSRLSPRTQNVPTPPATGLSPAALSPAPACELGTLHAEPSTCQRPTDENMAPSAAPGDEEAPMPPPARKQCTRAIEPSATPRADAPSTPPRKDAPLLRPSDLTVETSPADGLPAEVDAGGGDDLWCGSLMASTTPGRLVVQNLPGTPAAREAHNTPSGNWGADVAAPADEESPIVAPRAPRAWR